MRAIPVLVTPPARPVVSLEDARAHLRIADYLGPELGPVLGRVISACGFLTDLASEAPAPGKPEGAEAANGSAGTGAASVSGKACPPRAGSIC